MEDNEVLNDTVLEDSVLEDVVLEDSENDSVVSDDDSSNPEIDSDEESKLSEEVSKDLLEEVLSNKESVSETESEVNNGYVSDLSDVLSGGNNSPITNTVSDTRDYSTLSDNNSLEELTGTVTVPVEYYNSMNEYMAVTAYSSLFSCIFIFFILVIRKG